MRIPARYELNLKRYLVNWPMVRWYVGTTVICSMGCCWVVLYRSRCEKCKSEISHNGQNRIDSTDLCDDVTVSCVMRASSSKCSDRGDRDETSNQDDKRSQIWHLVKILFASALHLLVACFSNHFPKRNLLLDAFSRNVTDRPTVCGSRPRYCSSLSCLRINFVLVFEILSKRS